MSLKRQTQVYFEPQRCDERLRELGLSAEALITSGLKGLAAWADCTANHPPTYPGIAAWAETTRSLRDELQVTGWSRKNESNQPLVINADKTIAIAVSSGDEQTGRKDGFPCTRSAKGPKTANAVRVNKQQQAFDFMNDPEPVIASLKVSGRSTWLLLTFRDLIARELRCELSRPISMSEDGRVDEWAERIILSSTPFGDEVSDPVFGGGDGGQSPEIVVEIKKLG